MILKKKKNKTIKDIMTEKRMKEELRSEISKKQQLSDDTTIIVENKSKFATAILIFIEIIKIILRIIIVGIICVLATIGGTVLLNQVLRDYFFSTLSQFNII